MFKYDEIAKAVTHFIVIEDIDPNYQAPNTSWAKVQARLI
jgi:hypothetical protein